MKRILTALLLTLATAAFANPPTEIKARVNFSHEYPIADDAVDEFTLNHLVTLSTNNKNWVVIPNDNEAEQGKVVANNFIVLGKVEKVTDTNATLNFLVIDIRGNSNIVSQPKIVVPYGKSGELSMKDSNTKTHLSVKLEG